MGLNMRLSLTHTSTISSWATTRCTRHRGAVWSTAA